MEYYIAKVENVCCRSHSNWRQMWDLKLEFKTKLQMILIENNLITMNNFPYRLLPFIKWNCILRQSS